MKILQLLVGILLFIIVIQILGISYSSKEIFKSCQPTNIDYKSFGPYCLWINIEKQPLSSKLVLVIAKENDKKGVFHSLNYPNEISETDLAKITVLWNENGVEIKEPSGFKMEIPKSKFIGGR